MSIEKMREEFEVWVLAGPDALEPADLRWMDGRNTYYWAITRCMWEAWQASRESLAIELPGCADTGVDTGGWPLDSGSHRINKVIGQCREAIRAAGVKTK